MTKNSSSKLSDNTRPKTLPTLSFFQPAINELPAQSHTDPASKPSSQTYSLINPNTLIKSERELNLNIKGQYLMNALIKDQVSQQDTNDWYIADIEEDNRQVLKRKRI